MTLNPVDSLSNIEKVIIEKEIPNIKRKLINDIPIIKKILDACYRLKKKTIRQGIPILAELILNQLMLLKSIRK